MQNFSEIKFKLRAFKMSDAPALARHLNNPKIYKNTLHIPYPYTLKDAKTWLKKKTKNKNFAISLNGQVIGALGLHPDGHKAELGYWLAEEYWGKGIMTEAVKQTFDYGFNKMKLKRIFAYTYLPNKASQKVLLKAGFKKEGLLKKNVMKDGKYQDEYVFALVKE